MRAFTLAELLLSLGFISVSLLALLGVLTLSLRSSSQNRESSQAAQLAQHLFEEIGQSQNCPITPVNFTGQAAVGGFPPLPYPVTRLDETDYRLEVRCQPVAGRVQLYSVQVLIRWKGHQGSYESFFYQP